MWYDAKRFDGEPTLPPALEATQQRPDTRHAQPPKLSAARALVASFGHVQYSTISGSLAHSPLDVFGREPKRTRDRLGHGIR